MMQDKWIVVYITIVVMVAHSYAQNLSVSVVPTRSSFNPTQDVEMILSYKNNGPNDVLIYNWCLPQTKLLDPLFQLARDGEPIPYVGYLLKRDTSTAENTITLKAGEDVSTVVQLSPAYDMTQAGTYTVKYKVNMGSVLFISTGTLGIENTVSITPSQTILQSGAAVFYTTARSNSLIEKSAQVNTQERSATYEYNACSASQIALIAGSIQPAINYAYSSVQYLATMNTAVTTRYTTWFGRYSLANVIMVRKKFANIYVALNNKSMSFSCGCNMSSTYAYVIKSLPYMIYLCPVFWSSPTTGTDSMAGTLVHEISHFHIVADNADNAYGQPACQQLAITYPLNAVNNADSYQYFSENNPMLT